LRSFYGLARRQVKETVRAEVDAGGGVTLSSFERPRRNHHRRVDIVVREHVDTRWQDPDKLMPPGAKTRENVHSRVVRDVARQRLAFPNEKFPSLRTHVNVPEPALVVRSAEGAELAPDIVVAESPENRPRILAAIETVDTVTGEQAQACWLPFSQVPDTTFYLYVPSGFAVEARRLLKRHRIKGARLHTWRYVTGLDTLDITDTDYGGILELLLPPFLVRRRAS
jgi:hypothetical protein